MKQLALIVAVSVLAACGDNGATAPDAGPPDAPAGPPQAVIVAGDYTTHGVLSAMDATTYEIRSNVAPAGAVGVDPMLRHEGHELFVVNRAENNVTILDDHTFALVEQLATGANPQDVAVVGTKLYVPDYGGAGVSVLTRGTTTRTEIDLSADDPDGVPDCASAIAVGTDVYVACQLLAASKPVRAAKVYVIDSTTDTVQTARTITLLHRNPFSLFERIPAKTMHAGDLVISTVNDFIKPGCVERITPGSTESSCWVKGEDLTGYASRTAFQIDQFVEVTFFAVPTAYPKADLLAFDMPTDLLWAGALNPMTQAIGDVAVCPSGDLAVFDTTATASGLRMYTGAHELTTMPSPIGLTGGFSTHGLFCY